MFYFGVQHKQKWSFFIRNDPRGRPIKYNVIEEEDIEEVEEKVADDDGVDEEWDDDDDDDDPIMIL